jgi:hypothetical protein
MDANKVKHFFEIHNNWINMELKDVSWAMELATLVLLNGLGSNVSKYSN